jgi:predicted amidophosphoribosyltransferase
VPPGRFCAECGGTLAAPAKKNCTNCGVELAANAKFCAECGTPSVAAQPPAQR